MYAKRSVASPAFACQAVAFARKRETYRAKRVHRLAALMAFSGKPPNAAFER
jgi:hypothetical protein